MWEVLKVSVKFIISFFAISIIGGFILAVYVRLKEENISQKYIWFGIRKFCYYQFCVPFFVFPFIIYSQKELVAKLIVKDLLKIPKESQEETIGVLVTNMDIRFILMFWRLFLSAVNNEYVLFTDENIKVVKQIIKDKRKQEENIRSEQATLRRQIDLMDNDKSRRKLLDKEKLGYC